MTGKLNKQTTIAFRLTKPEKFVIQNLAADEIITPGKLMRKIIREWFSEQGIDDPLRWIADNDLIEQYRKSSGSQGRV